MQQSSCCQSLRFFLLFSPVFLSVDPDCSLITSPSTSNTRSTRTYLSPVLPFWFSTPSTQTKFPVFFIIIFLCGLTCPTTLRCCFYSNETLVLLLLHLTIQHFWGISRSIITQSETGHTTTKDVFPVSSYHYRYRTLALLLSFYVHTSSSLSLSTKNSVFNIPHHSLYQLFYPLFLHTHTSFYTFC